MTYWGSIAVMPKSGNFSVPDKPNDGPGKIPAVVTTAGDEKAPQPSKDSCVKVRVEVEVRGVLSYTDKAITVTARFPVFALWDDAKELPDAAATSYALDFARSKDLSELAKGVNGKEVVATGMSELRMVTPPARSGGGTGGGGSPHAFPAPTWSLQRTVLVTGLKSADK